MRQYVEQPVDGPLTLVVYPGADGAFALYEDDGRTFDYRKGALMRIAMAWDDRAPAVAAAGAGLAHAAADVAAAARAGRGVEEEGPASSTAGRWR